MLHTKLPHHAPTAAKKKKTKAVHKKQRHAHSPTTTPTAPFSTAKKGGFSLSGINTKPTQAPTGLPRRTNPFQAVNLGTPADSTDGGDDYVAPPGPEQFDTPIIENKPSFQRHGGLFGTLKEDLPTAIQKDREFLREGRPAGQGKQLFEAVGKLKHQPPTKLKLTKQTLDKERVDLSALTVYPYLENLKGAIIHHDLEQVLASVSGIMKFGGEQDVFDGRMDTEEAIFEKIKKNMDVHKEEYKLLLENVKAIPEIITYDLEIASKLLNQNTNINKLHCTVNTLQHLFNVYHIVPIPLNDPDLRIEHCSLDMIAEKIVKRSEEVDIPENGLEVYKERFNRPAIRIVTPLLGAIYMLVLKRYGYTTGLVHTPTTGLVFATPPLSKKTVTDPEIQQRFQQNSPYWYVNNLITDHRAQYKKTNLKLTPVDCGGLCTPSFANKKIQDLVEDFTCSCLLSPEAAYGGNFVYIDYLVNKVGQIPFTYRAQTKEDKMLVGGLELSTETPHSTQEKFNWDLPYPIYSYKTLAMRLIYEPIFSRDTTQLLGTNLELAASHVSSHVDDHPHRPKVVNVEYQDVELDSDDDHDPSDEDIFGAMGQDEGFQKFLNAQQGKGGKF